MGLLLGAEQLIMSRMALQNTRTTFYRWFLIESVILLPILALFLFSQGIHFALSGLLGTALYILPHFIFGRWWLSSFKANALQRLVKVFYAAEIFKLSLIGCLFVLSLEFFNINMVGCLVGFASAQIAFWLAPLLSSSTYPLICRKKCQNY